MSYGSNHRTVSKVVFPVGRASELLHRHPPCRCSRAMLTSGKQDAVEGVVRHAR